MARPLNELLYEELSLAIEPLVAATESDEQLHQLFLEIGWDIDAIPGFPRVAAQEALSDVITAYDAVSIVLLQPPTNLAGLQSAFDAVRGTIDKLRSPSKLLDAPGFVHPAGFERVGEDLVRYLTIRHMGFEHPTVYAVASLLTLIDVAATPTHAEVESPSTGAVMREPRTFPAFHPEHLRTLLANPLQFLKDFYVPGGRLPDDAAAERLAERLFPRLDALLESFDIETLYGLEVHDIYQHPTDSAIADHSIGVIARLDEKITPALIAGAICTLSPESRGNLGLVVTPFGTLTFEHTTGQWSLAATLGGAIEAFAIGPAGFKLRAGRGTSSVNARLSARKAAMQANEPAVLLGSVDGTRLEVGELAATATALISTSAQVYDILLAASRAALVIAAGEGDGFLQQILPKEGLRLGFDLGLGWSNARGIYFRGSAGLEATLPIKKSLFGLLTVDSAYLALRADERSGVYGAVAATTTVRLGPVTANVERFGLEARLTFPETGGNLGAADLTIEFKPPSGAGLVVDSPVVTGGGYLFFDPARQRYAGVLQLEIVNKVAVKAVGLLTTRMPDNRPGFSLIVVVTAEGFAPIALGFGFTLIAVGGLIGVHRTVLVDVLRAGLKDGALDAVLFPPDPIANAAQILSTLDTAFPAARDRFVFGPMARITWGTPQIATIDLALLLEVPEPVRLFVLGRLTAVLPDTDHPIAVIRLDALGVIDFDRGDLALDATLHDSRLAEFALTGDVAVRANWGAAPNFVLAIGGLHPRFEPPPNFPALSRVALSLGGDTSSRLRLEAYLAITSNTVQFGARLDLYAAAVGLEIVGFFAFDTLFVLVPFSFTADVGGLLAVRHDGRVLMAARVEMTLSGPRPWHVRGTATIEFFGLTASVTFEQRIGPAGKPDALPDKDVLPELRAALKDRRNWSTDLPADEHPLVTVRAARLDARVMHPLAAVTIRQRVVPLDRTITRIGAARPHDGSTFTVTAFDARGGEPFVKPQPVTDLFAPAQFRDMRDEEKLTAPAFEPMTSGLRFTATDCALLYQPAYDINIGYATLTIANAADLLAPAPPAPINAAAAPVSAAAPPPHVIPAPVLDRAIPYAAAATSPLWRTGRERFRMETV